jgi:hypothetical protein
MELRGGVAGTLAARRNGMNTSKNRTPSQSGRPDSRHDSLRQQATDRDASNQPRDDNKGQSGDTGFPGFKGQPAQRGGQDEQPRQNPAGEAPERQDGALDDNEPMPEGSLNPVPGVLIK